MSTTSTACTNCSTNYYSYTSVADTDQDLEQCNTPITVQMTSSTACIEQTVDSVPQVSCVSDMQFYPIINVGTSPFYGYPDTESGVIGFGPYQELGSEDHDSFLFALYDEG